jgi:hypothetical protein
LTAENPHLIYISHDIDNGELKMSFVNAQVMRDVPKTETILFLSFDSAAARETARLLLEGADLIDAAS